MATGNLIFTRDMHNFQMINNYLYFYHLNKFIVIPEYAESISDTSQANYASTTPLSRSAPIYSYQSSGPRTVSVSFTLHREMMKQINYENGSLPGKDDYVDVLIKQVQAATLPSYSVALKMVNPPIVALRMGTDIFIKWVITGSVGLTYKTPILEDGKYALVDLSLSIQEIDPYDTKDVMKLGSYRSTSTTNLNTTLARGSY